jgi:ATP/maltotriose-dependent transcriptional regulator MalT
MMQHLGSIAHKVLLRLEDHEFRVLRTLIFLDEVTNELAIEVSGDPRAPFVLAKLGAGSFFLTRTLAQPPTYQLNGIIRNALHDELSADNKELAGLYRRSFDALLKFGPKFKAFDLLTRTGGSHLIAELVKDPAVFRGVVERVRDCIYSGDKAELRIWARYLAFLEEPIKHFGYALEFYLFLIDGSYEEARAHLISQELKFKNANFPSGLKESLTRLFVIAEFVNCNFDAAVEMTLRVIRDGKSSDGNEVSFSSSTTFLRFGMVAALMTENHQAMKEIDSYVAKNPEPEVLGRYQINSLSIGATLAYFEGRLRVAEELAIAALSQSKSSGMRGLYAPFDAQYVLFQILTEQMRFDEADQILEAALEGANEIQLLPWKVLFLARGAISQAKRGEVSRASEFFAKAREATAKRAGSESLVTLLDRNEMILQHLLDGQMRVNEIRQRLPESQMTRLFTAQKHLRGNTKEFNKAMDELKEELPREAINSEVFKVIQNFEYPPKAREHLKRALAVAQEHGYYLYLLIQGDRFLSFLISSVSEMPSPFLERLVRDASERLRNKLTSSGVLADPLTRREADILRHLASEKPIAKIASELSITKNTMKTHLRHLYRKLNASDRRDAVAKGRELLNL